MEKEEKLTLQFDPGTIEALGIKMYSQIPHALAELIANAWDAAAKKVMIHLEDDAERKIIVIDDGDGMSFTEVQDKFLRIGRHRRSDEERTNSLGRKITGKKGLGKLALFGIGKHISIFTARKDDKQAIKFELDWDEILLSSPTYFPKYELVEKDFQKGTKIILSELTRVSDFKPENIAMSLSKMFNCFDKNFTVNIKRNNENEIPLTREMRFSEIDIQEKWDVSDLLNEIALEFQKKYNISGTIQASRKPTRQDLRGITLYANGRLINEQGFFDVPEAGHAFSYLSGWIDADYIDEFPEDLIATDRQSLSWDLPEPQELKVVLSKLIRDVVNKWSVMRREANEKKISDVAAKNNINLEEWKDTLNSNIVTPLENVIKNLASNETDDFDEENSTFKKVIVPLHELVPEYAQFHFRYLHEKVQEACEINYKDKSYYNAVSEACKAYVSSVKDKVEQFGKPRPTESDHTLIGKYFGSEEKKLIKIALSATKANGKPLEDATQKNLESSQVYFSQGVVAGFRNPIAHELIPDLKESIITEKHCLDALSLISMLFERLDRSEKGGENA